MLNLVVFTSGNGTTLQAILDSIEERELDAQVLLVVSDKEDAYSLIRAQNKGINTYVIKSKTLLDIDNELIDVLSEYDIDLIVLAGYLKMIGKNLISKYTIINTHPSLLPKYGGKGMYGLNVHRAVIENLEKESGATLHFVNEKYDQGNIIAQTKVAVLNDDTPESLAERVQKAEKIQLVDELKKISKQKIKIK